MRIGRIVGDMDLAHARDPGSLGGDAVHALPRHQQMNLAQLRRRGDRRQRGVLDGLAVVLDPDQRLHFATPPLTLPRAFRFATSSQPWENGSASGREKGGQYVK